MELSPEIKQQLEAQKANCIFCKIITGEMSSQKVYEDDQSIGILDIYPAVKGHTIFLPKDHYPILPFMPPETFKHIFGKLPKIVGALKKSMVMTGANIFIANGPAAGQQSQHFLIHILPREKGDGVNKFMLSDEKNIEPDKIQQLDQALAQNLPAMLANHFKRMPAPWHQGKGERPDHVKGITPVLYEDEKVVVSTPKNPQALGHMVVHSKDDPTAFENLNETSASHLWYVASYAATAVFEGLKAQGTNILLKTGVSDDNPKGHIELHVIPRYENDGIDLFWTPMEDKPDTETIRQKISDELFVISHEEVKDEPVKEVKKIEFDDPLEEIKEAIRQVQNS